MIDVYICRAAQTSGFVWNAEDAFFLRENYRIVGAMVGCLPRAPRQDNQLGLPLVLSREEIDLLVAENVAKTVTAPVLAASPSSEVKSCYDEYLESSYRSQVEVFKEMRKQEIIEKSDQIIEGKRKKLKRESATNDESRNCDEKFKEEILNAEFEKITDIPRQSQIIQTFNACPWIKASDKVDFDWIPSEDSYHRVRSATFRHLWQKGFFITSGEKFGGDFLVYPGDPCMFHAKYIVVCSPDEKILHLPERELVSHCRLGTAVNKTVLVSFFTRDGGIEFRALRRVNVKETKRTRKTL